MWGVENDKKNSRTHESKEFENTKAPYQHALSAFKFTTLLKT